MNALNSAHTERSSILGIFFSKARLKDSLVVCKKLGKEKTEESNEVL